MQLFLTIGVLILGFITVLTVILPVLWVARAKKIFEPFEKRKIHAAVVPPPLGSIAILLNNTVCMHKAKFY